MGLYSASRDVDISAISKRMQPIVNKWFNATIQIVHPNIAGGEYNVWDNATTGRTQEVLWSGKARMQPIRIPFSVPGSIDQFVNKTVRFQIPLDVQFSPDVLAHDGLRIRVTDGGMFPDAEHMIFVVTVGASSSFAWNRTIEAVVETGLVS